MTNEFPSPKPQILPRSWLSAPTCGLYRSSRKSSLNIAKHIEAESGASSRGNSSPKGLRNIAQGSQNPGSSDITTSPAGRTPTGFRIFKQAAYHPGTTDTEPRWGSALRTVAGVFVSRGALAKARHPFAVMRKALGLLTSSIWLNRGDQSQRRILGVRHSNLVIPSSFELRHSSF